MAVAGSSAICKHHGMPESALLTDWVTIRNMPMIHTCHLSSKSPVDQPTDIDIDIEEATRSNTRKSLVFLALRLTR